MKLDKWHSCEKWGWVFVWYHVDGIAPQYELPEYEDFDELKFGGCSDHIVDCHIEVPPPPIFRFPAIFAAFTHAKAD